MSRKAAVAAMLLALPACVETTERGPGQWESRKSLEQARTDHATAVLEDHVYAAGGVTRLGDVTGSVERYDPDTDTWTEVADLPLAVRGHGMAAAGDRLFVVGGFRADTGATDRVQSYAPATDRWTDVTPMPEPRAGAVAVAIDGQIYVLGGVDSRGSPVTDLFGYDPATDRWRLLTAMPGLRTDFAATSIDGALYVAGGRGNGVASDRLQRYDPASDRWTDLTPMPTARDRTGAAELDGRLVVCGGRDGDGRDLATNEGYDPDSDRWTPLTDMAEPVHDIAPVRLGDEVILAGGARGPLSTPTDSVVAFRDLPSGTRRYGVSTPACHGPIRIYPNSQPFAGNRAFELRTSPRAPSATRGALLIGGAADPVGTLLLRVRLHLQLAGGVIQVPVVSQPSGLARVPLPIPARIREGSFYAQFLFANTPLCPGVGPLSASDALELTVR